VNRFTNLTENFLISLYFQIGQRVGRGCA